MAEIKAPVGPKPICTRPSTEIRTSVQVAAVAPAKKFSGFSVIRPFRKSGYAIVNPSATQTSTVLLSLLDFSGRLAASTTVEVPPQGRISRFVQEFLPAAPSDFMGSLRILSTIPVGFCGVNVLFPEGEFSAINVAATPATVASRWSLQRAIP